MELLLYDRIDAIQRYVKEYGEDNFYISFSGGKDSTLLHYLIDEALPSNKIPRVFINTGIEYKMVVDFVYDLMAKDNRIVEIKPSKNIKETLEKYGYPFKSKEHSLKINNYKRGSRAKSVLRYKEGFPSVFACPKILQYQYEDNFTLKISDKCCYKLKKEPVKLWQKENHKTIVITGMRSSEGGQRASMNCVVINKEGVLVKFHPLAKITDEWEDWYINLRNIKLCELYYPPFKFKRTGCKGCPFSLNLQEQLQIMEFYLPKEAKQCEIIWKPVYDEYRRLHFRLKSFTQLQF